MKLPALSMTREVLVYGAIGVANTLVHFAVFWGTVAVTHSQTLGNALGFTVAVVFSFFMNASLTFRKPPTRAAFLRMYGSMLLVSLAFGALGDVADLHPVLTFALYGILNPVIGFLVTKFFVFS